MYKIYLCWHPQFPVDQLQPIRDLHQMIDQANAQEPDALANSMRLNWMVQDFQLNGINKPVLVNDQFGVIVGDTRIMAAKILKYQYLPVLVQARQPSGTVIHNRDELIHHCGLSGQTELIWRPQARDLFSQPVDWFEIDDPNTVGHWHDEQLRLDLMQGYLADRPGFQFSSDWYHCAIDWTARAKQLGH